MLPSAVLAGAVVAGTAAFLAPVAGAALLLPLAAICMLVWPALALPLLVTASATNRVAISWQGAQVRVEILLVLLLALVLVNRVAVRTLPARTLRSPLLLPLLAYTALNVVSTILFATEKARGLKLDAEIVASVLAYLVVTALIWRRTDLERTVRTIWLVTVLEAGLGLLFLVAYTVHLTSYGVQLGDFGLPMPYGTAWEANIFGSFLLGNFFLMLADYAEGRRSPLHTAGLIIVLAGIAASLTRTVWIGLVFGLLLFAAMLVRAKRPGSSLLPVVAGLPILGLAGLVVGSATPFAGRILDIINLHSSSASGRFVIFNAALADWRHHPLFGSGTGSFNFGAAPGQPHPWLPNLFLLTLHDTGLVGLAALLLFLIAFYRFTLGAVRKGGQASLLVAGSVAGVTALLTAFQTTSGFWFTYPWIVAGIGVAAARMSRAAT
jgi:O-antigen ligase